MGHSGAKGHSYDASSDFEAVFRTAERGGRRGHCPGARGHMGTRGSELSGLECKIHQLKLRRDDVIF